MQLFLWAFEEANGRVDSTWVMGEDLESVREGLGEQDKRFLSQEPIATYQAPVGMTDEQVSDVFKRIMNLALENGGEITHVEYPSSSKPS